MVCGIRALPVGAVLDGCSEHMVVDEKVGVAKSLDGLCIIFDNSWVIANFCLRENYSYAHSICSSHGLLG
jgi:hypothetical protein